MAEVLFRTETWAGSVDLATIAGRTFSDGEGEWDIVRGDLVTEGSQCRISAASATVSVAKDATFAARDFMRVEVEVQGDDLGICVRMQADERDYYLAYKSGTGLFIYRVADNVATFLVAGSTPGGAALGDTFEFECNGTTLRILWNGVVRVTTTDATYSTGVWGIRGVTPGEFFGDVNVYVDSSSIPTTAAPTTPVPTTLGPTTAIPTTSLIPPSVGGDGYTAVAFPSGAFAAGVIEPDGSVGLTVLSTATDVLTDACWDAEGSVYFAYKQGANVRLAKYDGQNSGAAADWDVALVSMQSANGRAMIDWFAGKLYVWVHNVASESNTPRIYRVSPANGSVIGGASWHAPTRSPSAAVEAANPGGANFGYYPAIRVTSSRVFLLGMDDAKENVYLEIVNLASKAQVANITLQTEASPDECYPRGLTVDPINEHCFVTWADYNDVSSRDEANRASYDLDGSLRWSSTAYVAGYDFVGGIAYDVDNDQLYLGGGLDAFGQADESITVVNPATGARTSGSTEPHAGAVVMQIGMNALDNGVILMQGTNLMRFTSALADPEEWSRALTSTNRVMRTDYLYASFPITTPAPTTPVPTSPPPTTPAPTPAPTTPGPTTAGPTTLPEPTFPPVTTAAVVTDPPTTLAPTPIPTTPGPSTAAPSTPTPLTVGEYIDCAVTYEASLDRLVIRAWLHNEDLDLRDQPLDRDACTLDLVDELGQRVRVSGVADPFGAQFVRFIITQARLYSEHLYLLEITLVVDGGPTIGPTVKGLPVS